MTDSKKMDFLVGTFTHDRIYTLRFTPPEGPASSQRDSRGKLEILHCSPAVGPHSWLTLSPTKENLYTTVWSTPPTIAAYSLVSSDNGITVPRLLNTKPVQARSGCIAASRTHVYSAGGNSGEVFAIRPSDGGFGELVQELAFEDLEASATKDKPKDVPHGDFGGIRHGAHSAELSPDGTSFYVADIGRNCVWAFEVTLNEATAGGLKGSQPTELLRLSGKHTAPRENDGPRHTTPHPNGRVLYSLQEHSSMVDVFAIVGGGMQLPHQKGVRIIPNDKEAKDYWADEVRIGSVRDKASGQPKYLYASTRGLKSETKGYVAVFELYPTGNLASTEPLDVYETLTSGGWANAVEPAPLAGEDTGVDYVAMTDSEEGWVFVLGFDGSKIWEAAKVKLAGAGDDLVGAATAVWI